MLQPPPEHVRMILATAAENPKVASRFVNAFNHPPDFFPWLADPAEAKQLIESLAG